MIMSSEMTKVMGLCLICGQTVPIEAFWIRLFSK